jgi:hypothetical protein
MDSNPARGMDVCLLCLYVVLPCLGRGLCDGLITCPEESYHVSCMCDHRNPKRAAKGKGKAVPLHAIKGGAEAKLKVPWSQRKKIVLRKK